jgi:2-polyprenyl-3-methyl-5-hydroxy-6-metoxy-1,4-benzoquinol methylase
MQRACPTCGAAKYSHVFDKNGYSLVACGECSLVFVSNLPTAEELTRLYDTETYHAEEVGESPSMLDGRATVNADLLSRHHPSSGRVLDVGCSAGHFLRVMKDRGWSTAGVELSSRSADVARSRHGLEVVTGTLDDAPWPEGSFDVVTLWDVIEHLALPGPVLDQAFALLKPGGLLVMATPAIDGLYPQVSLRATKVTGWWGHPEPPYHLQQYSKATITDLCARHGFVVRDIVEDRIPLGYSFGISKSVKRNLATAVMFPFALVGPWVKRGDSMFVVADRP